MIGGQLRGVQDERPDASPCAKRAFALENGGFNPVFRFGCEDIELGWRLHQRGLKVIFNPLAIQFMIRKLSLEACCQRLHKQGQSQYLFSRMHAAAEIQEWCEIPRYRRDWPELSKRIEQVTAQAHVLDRWARRSVERDVPLAYGVEQELHRLYDLTFRAHKLAGIAAAERTQSGW